MDGRNIDSYSNSNSNSDTEKDTSSPCDTTTAATTTTSTSTTTTYTRRSLLLSSTTTAATTIAAMLFVPTTTDSPVINNINNNNFVAYARTPGSNDVVASLAQIKDASVSLKNLLLENNWSDVASIDEEGRARSTDVARRVLGGIAPQAGTVAIDVAQNTPLYRIDVAFISIRKAVLLSEENDDGSNGSNWTSKVDLETFEELADRIVYSINKADGNFYSVLFAMKGTTMINDIFKETKQLLQQTIVDFDTMISLLQDAGAPI